MYGYAKWILAQHPEQIRRSLRRAPCGTALFPIVQRFFQAFPAMNQQADGQIRCPARGVRVLSLHQSQEFFAPAVAKESELPAPVQPKATRMAWPGRSRLSRRAA